MRNLKNSLLQFVLPGALFLRYLVLLSATALGNRCHGQILTTFTRPVQESSVATSESGVIVEKLVEEGSIVKAGQVLARLNDSVLKESLRLAKLRSESTVKIRATESTLKMRQSQWESLKDLHERGHGNQREVEMAKLDYDSAVSERELAEEMQKEAEIELARIQAEIEQRIIRSPIDGIVTTIFKEPGEYIAANDPVFCTIVRTDLLRADFYLDAPRLAFIRSQLKSNLLTLNVKISNSGETDGDIIVEGNVIYIAPTLDPKSETGRICLEFNNQKQQILSGSRCVLLIPEVTMPLSQSQVTIRN